MRGFTRRTRFLAVLRIDAFLAVAEVARLRLAATLEVERFARLTTFLAGAGAAAEVVVDPVAAEVGAEAAGAAGAVVETGVVPEASANVAGNPKPPAKAATRMSLVVFFILKVSVLLELVRTCGRMLAQALTGASALSALLCNPQASRWQT